MRSRKIRRMRNPYQRNRVFERYVAKLGMDQLTHEAAIRRRDDLDLMSGLVGHKVKAALALAKKVRNREAALVQAKAELEKLKVTNPHMVEGFYYVGYEKHMPIALDNPGFRRAKINLRLTEAELMLIINHPEMFPNPRLVYDLFDNVHWMMWDGKK